MEAEKILEQIRAGLTGDSEHDIAWLREQGDRYADHAEAGAILQEVGRMLYEVLTPEQREQWEQAMRQDMQRYADALAEVRKDMAAGELQSALEKIEALVKEVSDAEEKGLYRNDDRNAYFCFDELFEEVLYRETHPGGPEVRGAGIPYAAVYYHYGSLLLELKRYEEAEKALETAIRWNPSSAMFLFEYAEVFKVTGRIDRVRELTKKAFTVAFRPMTLARCYRNTAFLFSAEKKWEAAAACCWLSLQYDSESEAAQEELAFIAHESGEEPQPPEMDRLRALAGEFDFPLSADKTVLGLAYGCGQQCVNQKYSDMARYFLQIVYDLTHSADVKKLLEQLPQEKN